MKRIRIIGLALVAVVAFSAVAVATAAAHEFVASTTGTLTGKALNTHKFKTNAGTVECTSATPKGTVTSLTAKTQEVEVEYSGCTFTVFGTKKAKVTPNPKYNFGAEGWASVLNPSTAPIVIEVEGTGCNVKVSGSATVNHELTKVEYANLANGALEVKTKVTGITYTTTGGLCGSGGSNGTYEGNEEVKLTSSGSTLEWR